MYEKLQVEVQRQLACYERGVWACLCPLCSCLIIVSVYLGEKPSGSDVIETIRGVLKDKAWVWVGQRFVQPSQVQY